ncbi:30S ribosomal protein S7 [uncultured Murdochiella sp.]|uniref:30S ribosomal protein S7 n=1 Tax=uncultured Murdochiella sp. TaxID=1586095 RepID=UPI002805101B|nr:30S ribosomal protein S7 [uncultured Murdochiella sp.]
MSRKGHIPKREIMPDPQYNDVAVSKLINTVMLDGKKGLAQRIVYGAFAYAENKVGQDALEIYRKALANVMPVLEVKGRRIGGATYQVPMEVRPDRRQTLALRWIVGFARTRGEKTMVERLGSELVDAFNNTGASVRRKEEMHRMADANKAFAHFRY